MLPRASVIRFYLSEWRSVLRFLRLTFPLRNRRRSDFSDLAQAFRFGSMRPRDESSADIGRVPAGLYPETKRFFFLDVTRREILHLMLSVGPFDLGGNETDLAFTC